MKNIEWQVSNLENSKRLKELGVVQNSLFYWVDLKSEDRVILLGCGLSDYYKGSNWFIEDFSSDFTYSAYTTSELGVMLPMDRIAFCFCGEDGKYELFLDDVDISDDNEANARSKALIHLLQNKIITVEEVNRRIEGLQ